ncbi:Methyltransferase OMS1, mitochondrial [Smittium mucronatum]|uniref:Methyltransferase OMS1, mitochondrial n=1 Tax=Smittium mucronatum TaxID=133383 RepID=A0A1R0GYT7_9FUNG|nr:Methyltransferase OMS1, mitochondrial [Smittium mucronatum]
MSVDVENFLAEYKKDFYKDVKGSVLEIGPGYGTTLKHLNSEKISKLVLLEPNKEFLEQLKKTASELGYDEEVQSSTEKSNPDSSLKHGNKATIIVNDSLVSQNSIPKALTDNGPYDSIISSLVLCSVDDVDSAVNCIAGLLKPGGKFYFIEHKAVPYSLSLNTLLINVMQRLVTPFWSLVSGNCHLDRKTVDIIKKSPAWESVEIINSDVIVNNLMGRLAPMTFGIATKKM